MGVAMKAALVSVISPSMISVPIETISARMPPAPRRRGCAAGVRRGYKASRCGARGLGRETHGPARYDGSMERIAAGDLGTTTS